jgi:hypothetical protein
VIGIRKTGVGPKHGDCRGNDQKNPAGCFNPGEPLKGTYNSRKKNRLFCCHNYEFIKYITTVLLLKPESSRILFNPDLSIRRIPAGPGTILKKLSGILHIRVRKYSNYAEIKRLPCLLLDSSHTGQGRTSNPHYG